MLAKRFLCMVSACMLTVSATFLPVHATEPEAPPPGDSVEYLLLSHASGSFNVTIPSKTKLAATTSFPLAAGDTVTIKASYAPFSESVDFGLIAPNSEYYYLRITDGSVDATIQVPESGLYTLQIRNHSDIEVEVAGFVKY